MDCVFIDGTAEPFSGDGIFLTVTFTILSTSVNSPFELKSVTLSDDTGQAIEIHQYQDLWREALTRAAKGLKSRRYLESNN